MTTQQDLFIPQFRASVYQQALFDEIRDGSGHILVRAVAGSGKTTTIVRSIEVIHPDKTVLLCAFNREICRTLAKRVEREADVETFHAIGYGAIRRAWGKHVFVEESRDRDILGGVIEQAGLTYNRVLRRHLLQLVSLAKGYLAWTNDQFTGICRHHDLQIDQTYFDAVRQCLTVAGTNTGSVSFDDMIFTTVYAQLPLQQYDVVLIDETQDLNYAQWYLAKKSVAPNGRIIAVGDQRQAIYQFRGARQNAMSQAAEELNAKQMPLSVTYRCPTEVVRFAKKYAPEIEAAPNAIAGSVEQVNIVDLWKEYRVGDLVLSRANGPLISLCLKAIKREIRSRILGRSLSLILNELIDRSKRVKIDGLLEWLDWHENRERARLIAAEEEEGIEEMLDRVASVKALCEDLHTTEDLRNRIASLCVDNPKDDAVLFSSVHRAKGLEANRVWVAQDTFKLDRPNPVRRTEEENLFYVAITRTKQKLFLFNIKDYPVEN